MHAYCFGIRTLLILPLLSLAHAPSSNDCKGQQAVKLDTQLVSLLLHAQTVLLKP